MESQNRILVIGYLPGVNGISTSVLNLFRHLDRNIFQYDFLIQDKYRDDPTPDMEELVSLGANIYYMNYDKYSFPESSHKELEELLLSITNLRGVHVHDLNMMSYPLYLADKLGFPIKVIQCHTAMSKSKSNTYRQNAEFAERLKLIEGNQYDRLACSDLAGRYDYYDLPYTILQNGVDTERFSYNPVYRSLIRDRLGIPEQSCIIGSVATLSKGKNHSFALDVFRQFLKKEPESHYLIVGSGPLANDIKKSIEDNDLSDHVHLVGLQREVDLFYSAMDILLHPSVSEGLPNTLVEAQATGLPCLISDQISDMIKITPLVMDVSLDEKITVWVEKLCEIKSSPQKRNSRGKEIKAAGYDIRDVANHLIDIYSDRIRDDA